MKFFLTLLLLVSLTFLGFAQDLKPCGTLPYKAKSLTKFQRNIDNYRGLVDSTILQVPISLHVVSDDNGSGNFSYSQIQAAMCALNNDYDEANVRFFIQDSIHYIKSSAWYNHETVLEGAEMMFANNIPNTINCYIVNDPAGNCGYNLPYAGIALAKSCLGPADHTWAHEVGHNLTLPHPFIGWEGKSYNYGDTTPIQVTYDYTYFKDTLIIDTVIIDTAWVEYVDRSNCEIAADGFCDTSPDYISYRWPCDGNSNSLLKQKDPADVDFYSDGTLIMSYSDDVCVTRFSPDQILAMRYDLTVEKADFLYPGTLPAVIPSETETILTHPINGEIAQYDSVNFHWDPVENATEYVFQLSLFSSGGNPIVKEQIDTNYINVTNLIKGQKYYWKVRPVNPVSFCTQYSDLQNFKADELVTVINVNSGITRIFPNPIKAGNKLSIHMESKSTSPVSIIISNLNGKQVFSSQLSSKDQFITFDTPNIPGGIYLLNILSEDKVMMERISITN
jgi:hypothetical protein